MSSKIKSHKLITYKLKTQPQDKKKYQKIPLHDYAEKSIFDDSKLL